MRYSFIRRGSFAILGALLAFGSAQVHAVYYWDTNGATPGSGNTGGTWSDASWTSDDTGSTATTTLPSNPYATAVFSAGTDGTGTFMVTVPDGTNVPTVTVEEGDVTLRLTGTTYVSGTIGAKMLFDGGTFRLAGVSDGRAWNGTSYHNAYDTSSNFRITGGTTAVFDVRQLDLQNPFYWLNDPYFASYPFTLSGRVDVATTGGLTKTGGAAMTLKPSAGYLYTGATTLRQGRLTLDFSDLAGGSDLISASSALVLGGGATSGAAIDTSGIYGLWNTDTGNLIPVKYDANSPYLTFQGGTGGGAVSQTFNGLTVKSGAGATLVRNGVNGSVVNVYLGNITRETGATIDFVTGGGVATTGATYTTRVNDAKGILGGWATVRNIGSGDYKTCDNWAVGSASGSSTAITAFSGYTAVAGGTATLSSDLNYRVTGGSLGQNWKISASSTQAHTLNLAVSTSNQSMTLLGGTLALNAGGVLFNGYRAFTINGPGQLGANGSEVIIIANRSANPTDTTVYPLTINAPISGPSGQLTKSGLGILKIPNLSQLPGSVNIAEGILEVSPSIDSAYGGTISGYGTFSKTGTATMKLTSPLGVTNLWLSGGKLDLTSLSSVSIPGELQLPLIVLPDNRQASIYNGLGSSVNVALPASATIGDIYVCSGNTLIVSSGNATITDTQHNYAGSGAIQLHDAVGTSAASIGYYRNSGVSTLEIRAGASLSTTGPLKVGVGVGTNSAAAAVRLLGGNLTVGSWETSGNTPGARSPCFVYQTGGEVTVNGTVNPIGTTNGGIYTMTGGTLNAGGPIVFATQFDSGSIGPYFNSFKYGHRPTMNLHNGTINFADGINLHSVQNSGPLQPYYWNMFGGTVTNTGGASKAISTNYLAELNLYGGLLDMQGGSIGTGTALTTIRLDGGTLRNAAAVNGTTTKFGGGVSLVVDDTAGTFTTAFTGGLNRGGTGWVGANATLTDLVNGTLTVVPQNGHLGSGENVTFATAPTVTNTIIAPWAVAQQSGSDAAADFLTYSGGLARASYTNTNFSTVPDSTKVVDVSANQAINTTAVYALKVTGSAVSINGGNTLTVGDGTGQAGLILNNGSSISGAGTLAFGWSEALVYAGGGSSDSTISTPISGLAGLTKFGPGRLLLTGDNSALSGGVNVQGGALRITSASNVGSVDDPIVVGPAGTLELQGDVGLGAAPLTLAGTLRNVSGNNTLGSLITGGTLTIGSGARIASDSGLLTLEYAALDFAPKQAINYLSQKYYDVYTQSPTLTFDGAGDIQVSTPLANPGLIPYNDPAVDPSMVAYHANISLQYLTLSLTKDGPGKTVLTGTLGYTGRTTVNQGVLQFNTDIPVDLGIDYGDPDLAIAGDPYKSSVTVNFGGVVATDLTVQGSGTRFTTLLGKIAGASTGVVALTGGTISGALDMSKAGGASLGTLTTATISGTLTPADNVYRLGGGGGTLTVSTSLANGSLPNSLVAGGGGTGGTVVLSNTNTFTGPTSVKGGVLVVNGSLLSTGTVSVDNGGTLRGYGSVGNVTVQSGGILAPGRDDSTLESFSVNSLMLQSGAASNFRISLSALDRLYTTGAVSFGGVLNVTDFSGGLLTAGTYDLFDFGSHSGAFSSINLPAAPSGLQWKTFSGSLFDYANGLIQLEVATGPTVGKYWAPTASGGGSGTWSSSSSVWATASGMQGTLAQSSSDTLEFTSAAGTVSVSGAVSVAKGMTFSTDGYRIQGGTLSLSGATVADNTITLSTGAATIASPISLGGDAALNVTATGAGTGLVLSGPISGSGRSLTKNGGGTLVLDSTGGPGNSYTGGTTVNGGAVVLAYADALPLNRNLTIGTGATVHEDGNLGSAVQVGGLTITGTGTFNLSGGKLIVDGSVTSEAAVRAYLVAGRSGNTWAGAGITSSWANANSVKYAVGYMSNSDLGSALAYTVGSDPEAPSTWFGRSATMDSVFVRLTYAGDADLSGEVTTDDFDKWKYSYAESLSATWYHGDFDYSGAIDTDDFDLWKYAYSFSYPALDAPSSAAVPEPGTLALLALGCMGLWAAGLARRRLRK